MSALEGTDNTDRASAAPERTRRVGGRRPGVHTDAGARRGHRLAADLAEMQRNVGRPGAPGPSGYDAAAEGAGVAIRLLSQLLVDAAPEKIVAAAAVLDRFPLTTGGKA